MKVLLIDDVRSPSYIKSTYGVDVTDVARTYDEGIEKLKNDGPWDLLMLDHDLNSYVDDKEYTGTDIMKFLQKNQDLLPKDIRLVTANFVGRQRMQAIINDIKKEKES